MSSETTSAESDSLGLLIATVRTAPFITVINRLHRRFGIYATTCPAPLSTPGLVVTQEIRNQCECYLPVAEIAAAYYKLYRAALFSPPVLSSTPFHNALSWADVLVQLPSEFQRSADPSILLIALLADKALLKRFLFASFLPDRFYGGAERYPGQKHYIREWLLSRNKQALRCLDAACGTGEEVFGLCLMLSDLGFPADTVMVDGWTVEPLEVWAASQRRLPHNRRREMLLRKATEPLFARGFANSLHFSCQNIIALSVAEQQVVESAYHLIICNGLLGGPIINKPAELDLAVSSLVRCLAPGGMLLVADNFHGGWKRKCPQSDLRALLIKHGLKTFHAGEGLGGLKPD